MKPWPHVRTEPLENYRIFRVRKDWKTNPRTGAEHDFFVLEAPDWVNIVAITNDGFLIMVEQYRVGSNTIELEIPGGVMDPEDRDPVATAVRELREETGYEGENPRLVADVFSNPAIMNNRTHTVFIDDCVLKHDTEFDCGEDLVTKLVPVSDIPDLLRAGRIKHPLVHVALSHYLLMKGAGRP